MHLEDPERFVHELDRLLAGQRPESDHLSEEDATLLEWSAGLAKHQPSSAGRQQVDLRQRLGDRLASRTPAARLLWTSLVCLVAITGLLVIASLVMYSTQAEPAIAADNAAPAPASLTLAAPLFGSTFHSPTVTPLEIAHPIPTPLAPRKTSTQRLAHPLHTPLAATRLATP